MSTLHRWLFKMHLYKCMFSHCLCPSKCNQLEHFYILWKIWKLQKPISKMRTKVEEKKKLVRINHWFRHVHMTNRFIHKKHLLLCQIVVRCCSEIFAENSSYSNQYEHDSRSTSKQRAARKIFGLSSSI